MGSNLYKFTEIAKRDLDDMLFYISNVLFNPTAAKDLFDKIEEKIAEICDFPECCPMVENDFVLNASIRKALVGNFVMYYSYDADTNTIWVLRFVFGRRNLQEILKSL